MSTNPRSRSLAPFASLLSSSLLLAAGSASAVDGVLEIDQTCATLTGCFGGDPAGFPVEITRPGSYRLTSNLVIPNSNTTGIQVADNDVTLDLNGFSIIRAGCAGAVVSCAPPNGTGDGVNAFGFRRTTVRDGSIVGMGGDAVDLGESSHVTSLRTSWNHGDGIKVLADSRVSANTSLENDRDGIDADGSNVLDNVVVGNGASGIDAGIGAVIESNAVERNAATGIVVIGGATIRGNSVRENGADGISGGQGSNLSDNIVNFNGGDGIATLSDCLVSRNVARANDGFGLDLDTSTAYRENVINANALGSVDSGINEAGNSCNATNVCP